MLDADRRYCYLLLPRCVSVLCNLVNNKNKLQALAHPAICGSPIMDRVLVLRYIADSRGSVRDL